MDLHEKMFKCGACLSRFEELMSLHSHLQISHGSTGSYFYEGSTKTAFPRYTSACVGTQTWLDVPSNILIDDSEIEVEDNSENIYSDNVVEVGEDSLDELFEDIRTDGLLTDQTHVFADELEQLNDSENGLHVKSPESLIETPSEIHPMLIETKARKKLSSPKVKKRVTERGNRGRKKKGAKKNKMSKKSAKQSLEGITLGWKCDFCFQEFEFKQDLVVHKNKEHQLQANGKVKCNLCCRLLTTRAALKRHLLVHLGLSPFDCETCKKAFRTAAELNHHKLSHSDKKNYICQYCGEAFSSPAFLRLHIQRCLDIRPFKCEHVNCTQSFRSKNSLLLHERRHTGEKPYICDQCGDSFSRADKLVKHTYLHSGDKPYQCSVCPKAFATRDHLQRHEQIHSGKLSFVCSHCGKGFAQNWNLKAHMRQHSGEKPYKCDICGQEFAHNVSRKTHMAKAHQIQNDTLNTCG